MKQLTFKANYVLRFQSKRPIIGEMVVFARDLQTAQNKATKRLHHQFTSINPDFVVKSVCVKPHDKKRKVTPKLSVYASLT